MTATSTTPINAPPEAQLSQELLTIAQAAQALGISAGRVQQFVTSGRLPTIRRERRQHFIPLDNVVALAVRRDQERPTQRELDERQHRAQAKKQRLAAARAALDEALRNGMVLQTDAARELGVSKQRVNALLNVGRLPAVEKDGLRGVSREGLDVYKASDRRPGGRAR